MRRVPCILHFLHTLLFKHLLHSLTLLHTTSWRMTVKMVVMKIQHCGKTSMNWCCTEQSNAHYLCLEAITDIMAWKCMCITGVYDTLLVLLLPQYFCGEFGTFSIVTLYITYLCAVTIIVSNISTKHLCPVSALVCGNGHSAFHFSQAYMRSISICMW